MPGRASGPNANRARLSQSSSFHSTPENLSQLSQFGRYDEKEVKDKARDLVRFFLATAGRKQSVKRQEIVEKVLKDMSKAFNLVLEEAKSMMLNTFGLKISEVDQPNKTFCLTNDLELEAAEPHLQWSDGENQILALLMTCLSIIFMSGDVVQDDILWSALKRLELDPNKTDNPVFGDVKKLITQDFVQQGYLVTKRHPDTDPPKLEFTWGPRAHAMTCKEDVLSFVCQIYDNMEMFDWQQQYDAIHGEGAAAKAKEEAQSV